MADLDQSAVLRVAALIPAAGSGQRMGGGIPKPYQVLQGREILARTLDVFEACAIIHEVWLVVAADLHEFCRQRIVEPYGFRKVQGLVVGGSARQESVWRGLQHVAQTVDVVVIHDGVRPFVTASLLQHTVDSAVQHGAATAAVPLHDTLKRVSASGLVEATIPRDHLWRTQTPQAFRLPLLLKAFEHAWQMGLQATDEAGLVEALGHPVYVVPGTERNVKITTPDDLNICEGFLHHPM